MDYILLIVGLALLAVCAEMLTRGAAAMAARFRVPELIVGLTVVAVGTSMPELTVSAMSAVEGNSSMAIGNVTGSNIFNILIILGICALIKPLVFTRENIRRDIPMCIAASVILLAVTYRHLFGLSGSDTIGRVEGIVMLLLYAGVMIYSIRSARHDAPDAQACTEVQESSTKPMAWSVITLLILVGLGGLIFGGNMCLKSATAIARAWGVSESVIAITIVAAGTSLPELASSVAAVVNNKFSMAIGNIIGSNIFNILFILGTSATIKPLTMGSITPLDLWMVLGAAVVLLISAVMVGVRRITRAEGVAYIAIYVAYIFMLMR